jgi:hypothetical protein
VSTAEFDQAKRNARQRVWDALEQLSAACGTPPAPVARAACRGWVRAGGRWERRTRPDRGSPAAAGSRGVNTSGARDSLHPAHRGEAMATDGP